MNGIARELKTKKRNENGTVCAGNLVCVLVRETAKVHGIVEIQSLFQQTDKPSDFRIVLASLVDCYSNHITTRISIQTAVLAFGGTGLCSYRVRGVGGSCPKHLTVESYKAIYAANSHTYYY